MHTKPPLTRFVIGVLVVLAIILCFRWFIGGRPFFSTVAIFCAGYLIGMLAMYIAVHLYSWK
jgi:uncharacterized membrane protein